MINNNKSEQGLPKPKNIDINPGRRRKWYSNFTGRGNDNALLALMRAQAMLFKSDNKKNCESTEDQRESK